MVRRRLYVRLLHADALAAAVTTAHTEALEDARQLVEINRRWKANEMSGTAYATALQPYLSDAATLAFARALVVVAGALEVLLDDAITRNAWVGIDGDHGITNCTCPYHRARAALPQKDKA